MLVSIAQWADGTPARTKGSAELQQKEKKKKKSGRNVQTLNPREEGSNVYFLLFYPPPVFWFPLSVLPASVLISSVPPGFLEKSETDKQAVTRLNTTPDGLWLKRFGLNLLWHFTRPRIWWIWDRDPSAAESGSSGPLSNIVWRSKTCQRTFLVESSPAAVLCFYSCWITICFAVVLMSDMLSKSLIYCSTFWIAFTCFTNDNCNVKTLLI